MNGVPIVGVGASAGGLEAVQALLEPAEPDCPYAIVIIQHLAPDYASMTADILGRHTRLPVYKATEDVEVRPGVVYVIEPKTVLELKGDILSVEPRGDVVRLHRPIDLFFTSLAEERGAEAHAVVLSGTGSDGTEGARAVKEAGGFVIVQSPQTARFDGMPRGVISARCHDLCLPPAEILPRLGLLVASTPVKLQHNDHGLEAVLTVLAEHEDVDLHNYREKTVRRRIERRVALAGRSTIEDYIELLETDSSERTALITDLFIGVTRFFRDPEAYQALQQQLQQVRPAAEPFRVWVCGCSTGEEAYSLTMVLWRVFMEGENTREIKIFATDVSQMAIRSASRGVFTPERSLEVPAELRARFMLANEDGNFVIDGVLRNRIVFSQHDALRDPPFSRLDLIVCRNMLIYLEPEAQQDLLQNFSFSLKENGLLWLGPSESGAEKMPSFATLDSRWKLFRNIGHRNGTRNDWKVRPMPPAKSRRPATALSPRRSDIDWKLVHDDLSTGFLPSHVIVNAQYRLLYQYGSLVKDLLRFPDGESTTDIRVLLPQAMRPAVESLVSEALRGIETEVRQVVLEDNPAPLDLKARGLRGGPDLVAIFVGEDTEKTPAGRVLKLSDIESDLNRRVESLELELLLSRESLQSTVEELESSNEELQATNEELLASNEELQSVNEELQSVNEELHTVNAEHQQKIVDLGILNNDLDTLLASMDHGVLFLDSELRVRRFNPAVIEYVSLVRSDIGRPFGHLTHSLDGFALLEACAQCLRSNQPHQEMATGQNGSRHLLLRFTPLVKEGNSEGIVLSITDITSVEHLRQSRSRFLAALDTVDLPFALLSLEGEIEYANKALADQSGRDARYLVGTNSIDLVHPEFSQTWITAINSATSRQSWEGYLQLSRPDGSTVSEIVRLTPSITENGTVTGIVRLTLMNSHTRNYRRANKSGTSFFFGGIAPADTIPLLVQQLARGGQEREQALSLVDASDRSRIAEELIACHTADGGNGSLTFMLNLSPQSRVKVSVDFKPNGESLTGRLRGVEWRLDQQLDQMNA